MTSSRVTGPPQSVDLLALAAIVNAYYPSVLAEPGSVRARAQVAYTVASAIAGALVTAGALSGVSSLHPVVQAFGALAVAAWLVATGLFVHVAKGVTVPSPPEAGLLTADTFAQHALDATRKEATRIEGRLDAAARATWAALGLTGIAMGGALLVPDPTTTASARVVLSEEGRAAVAAACGEAGGALEGDMDLDSLDDRYAVIEVARGRCQAHRPVVLRVTPRHIVGVASEGSSRE